MCAVNMTRVVTCEPGSKSSSEAHASTKSDSPAMGRDLSMGWDLRAGVEIRTYIQELFL
jgi:hypothetical protein